jgi:hypothetical protein
MQSPSNGREPQDQSHRDTDEFSSQSRQSVRHDSNKNDRAAKRSGRVEVNSRAQDKRNFASQDVANHAASHTRYHAEHDRGDVRCRENQRFLRSQHGKERESACIDHEQERRGRFPTSRCHKGHGCHGRGRENETRIRHPERICAQDQVTQRSSAQGGDEREYDHSEKIDALVLRREHAGDREYGDAEMFKEVAHELGLFCARLILSGFGRPVARSARHQVSTMADRSRENSPSSYGQSHPRLSR